MSTEDREALSRAAKDVAELLVELAAERPQVLQALRSLLLALRADAVPATSAPPQPFEHPETPAPVPDATEATEATALAEEPPRAHEAEPAVHSTEATPDQRGRPDQPTPAVRGPERAHQQAPSAKDQASLSRLLSMFGDPVLSNGLGHGRGTAQAAPPPGRWDEDVDEAKLLARILRAQARRLKAIRIALHEGRPVPPVDHLLADARIEDWTTDERRMRRIDAHRLKEGERWYALTARAAAAVGDWLVEFPQADLREHRTPEPFKERLQCLADAQKGIFCWMEKLLGKGSVCGVQTRTYGTLRAWVDREHFGVYLPSGMQLSQSITSDRREDIERFLHRFELEHARDELPEAAASTVAPSPPRRQSSCGNEGESSQAERFECVLDAFLAAKGDFGGERLVFTARAEESAEDSAFMRPDEVYEFFRAMSEIASGLAGGAMAGTPLPLLFQQRGYKSKNSSPSSRQRFHRFYHMNFEEREIDLSLHVTLGSRNQNTCMSIHWWHDSERKQFVIGHCGKHLPNSLT